MINFATKNAPLLVMLAVSFAAHNQVLAMGNSPQAKAKPATTSAAAKPAAKPVAKVAAKAPARTIPAASKPAPVAQTITNSTGDSTNAESTFLSKISVSESSRRRKVVSDNNSDSSEKPNRNTDREPSKTKPQKEETKSDITSLEACQNELAEQNYLASQIIDQELQKQIALFEKYSQSKALAENKEKAPATKDETNKASSTSSEKALATAVVNAKENKPAPQSNAVTVTAPSIPTTPVISNSTSNYSASDKSNPLSKFMADASYRNPELRKIEIETQILQASRIPNGLNELKQRLLALNQSSSEGLAKLTGNPEVVKTLEAIMKKDPSTLSESEKLLLSEMNRLQTQSALAQEYVTQIAQYELKSINSVLPAGNTTIVGADVNSQGQLTTFRGRPLTNTPAVVRTRNVRTKR